MFCDFFLWESIMHWKQSSHVDEHKVYACQVVYYHIIFSVDVGKMDIL
jgi:hypothetical protein